jgi:pimeloyl-ACP methyl ester carboxylesterase
VLAIQGASDEFFTRAQLDALCQLIPGRLETFLLSGCGHAPHQQATSAVVEAITRFIGRVSRANVAAVPSFT